VRIFTGRGRKVLNVVGKSGVYQNLEVKRMVRVNPGIYQIHWCIHGHVAMPFSLTDKASPEEAAEIIEKTLFGIKEEQTLQELFREKLSLSEALSWER
jgi:hypothetical protein